MSYKPVDYDQIAPTYDLRFAHQDRLPVVTALINLVRRGNAKRVLEVGCGTGHWLHNLRLASPDPVHYRCVGLDLSAGMLHQAQNRDAELLFVQGQAEALPFVPACFDLIYCVNALHHFYHQQEFIKTCLKWLNPGGALAIFGTDPHDAARHAPREQWYVYEYFENVLATDLKRFPGWKNVSAWMTNAGYVQVSQQLIETIQSTWEGVDVFTDPFLQKAATSQLALLTDRAYQAGMEQIKDAIITARGEGREIVFQTVIHMDMLVGYRPS